MNNIRTLRVCLGMGILFGFRFNVIANRISLDVHCRSFVVSHWFVFWRPPRPLFLCVMSCHLMSRCHVVERRVVSALLLSRCVASCHVASCFASLVVSGLVRLVVSCHVLSSRVVSGTVPCRVVPRRVASSIVRVCRVRSIYVASWALL